MLRRTIFSFAIMCFLFAAPSRAQSGRGILSGYVLSADGARVAHARVYLQPGNGRAAHTTLTNEAGHYSFLKVRPGLYDVRAHAGDSWSEPRRNVVVRANQEMNVDLKIVAPGKSTSGNPAIHSVGRLSYRTEAEYARRAVCLGAADGNKPGCKYLDKMDEAKHMIMVQAPRWV